MRLLIEVTIEEDGFSVGVSTIDFNEDQGSLALINDKFDLKSLNVNRLNPIDHVVGSLFKETVGQEFGVIRSGEVGDLDVVNNGGEDAVSEVLFDVVLNLLDGFSGELRFHFSMK